MNKTVKALIARGLDSEKAVDLVRQGETIASLKQKNKKELAALGLDEKFIDALLNETRPPIPAETVDSLLYKSRYCCCVCRDNKKPIVIHHMVPWEKSHSHEEDNLVVLCPLHHTYAHTKSELTLNLTVERLKSFKTKWFNEVRQKDAEAINNLLNSDHACWDFFNVFRIFEIVNNMDIDYKKLPGFDAVRYLSFVDDFGSLLPVNQWKISNKKNTYWLDFYEGMFISSYMTQIMLKIIELNHFKILNDIWNKEDIKSNIQPNDFVILQGAFYFKKLPQSEDSNEQLRIGYRQASKIKIEFVFNAYYSTSSSARCDHLSGRKVETLFAIVREIKEENDTLVIRVTALSMGCCFNQITTGRKDYESLVYYEDDGDIY